MDHASYYNDTFEKLLIAILWSESENKNLRGVIKADTIVLCFIAQCIMLKYRNPKCCQLMCYLSQDKQAFVLWNFLTHTTMIYWEYVL